VNANESFHPCSCGGSNESCYRCSGTGIAGVRPGTRGAPLPTKATVRKSPETAGLNSPTNAEILNLSSIYCSICRARFNPLYWKKHQRTAHGPSDKGRPAGAIKAADLARCPSCRQRVTARRLQKHIKRVHSSRSSSSRNIPEPKMNSTAAGLASIRNERQERLLDRTRNYGFPCRESGRFGSHPSHDGFDDESNP
jgi:hypothetical protein